MIAWETVGGEGISQQEMAHDRGANLLGYECLANAGILRNREGRIFDVNLWISNTWLSENFVKKSTPK